MDMKRKCIYVIVQFAIFAYLLINTNAPALSETIYHEAEVYLDRIPLNRKIYVWPIKLRVYELIGDKSPDIAQSIEEYANIRRDVLYLTDELNVPQISIVTSQNFEDRKGVNDALSLSNLPSAYKKFAMTAPLTADGCAVYRFTTRSTWAAAGLMFVDLNKFGKGRGLLSNCVHAGLDFINGIPTSDDYFYYSDAPSENARRQILVAITKCSTEGTGEGNLLERTRDGIIPLPSIKCVKKAVATK
jgi:hypothetical protein